MRLSRNKINILCTCSGWFSCLSIVNLKPGVGNHPVITYATPEPGRLGCVISIEIGVNGAAYPAAVSQKVANNLPVSFYSPTSGFNLHYNF